MYPSVKFQRASSTLETFTAGKKNDISKSQNGENGNLSGADAREFYESLTKESNKTDRKRKLRNSKSEEGLKSTAKKYSDNKKVCVKKPIIEKDKKRFSDSRQENIFLRTAQDGDIDGLKRIIRDNKVDINATDQFGWTALMCAAKNSHEACVKFLLKEGADVSLLNNTGQTAKDIAKQSGVYDLFRRKSRRHHRESDVGKSQLTSDVEQTCDICKSKFSGPKNKHDSSTAHLFNCQYKTERTFYHIPENNIGFKLMQQKGWDKEKGLGPEGTGRKFPVKTILKQDRLGLGSKRKEKAKITHFSPGDTSAVDRAKDGKMSGGARVPRKTWKRKLIQKQEKEKNWEHTLRVYMNTE